MQISLAASSIEAAHSFERLCSLLNDAECEGRSALTKHEAEDQSTRFRLWAGNIGAFHRLPSTASLDYRLRESPNVAIQIQEHLKDLNDCLNTVCSIALGERPNRPIDSDDEDEQEDYEDFDGSDVRKFYTDDPHESIAVSSSEAEESFGTAKDTITGLFRLSILIRKYTPRDRFSRALSGPNPFDETFDVAHVSQKFPKLDQAPYAWLKLRLGRAITQRRRYLQYAREHRQKLGHGLEESGISSIPIQPSSLAPKQLNFPMRSEAGVTRTLGHPSTLTPTNASTLLLPSSTVPDEDLEDSQSQTSFAISLEDEDRNEQFHLPTLADVLNGNETFECPLCWTIQSFRKESTWRKHVLADLRPYVCTFKNCDLKLFPHRQSWFDHELSHHRRTWSCLLCQQRNFKDPDVLRQHLGQYHLHDQENDQIDTVVESGTHTVVAIAASECPFCDEWQADLGKLNPELLSTAISVTPMQFRNHVGTHMQNLALFAIPRGALARDDLSEGSVASARAAGRAPTISSTTNFGKRLERARSVSIGSFSSNSTSFSALDYRHRAGLRSYPCPLAQYNCADSFSSKRSWTRHAKSGHFYESYWLCDMCDALAPSRFHEIDHFTEHIRSTHLTGPSDPESLKNDIQNHVMRCSIQGRRAPHSSSCPLCDEEFVGPLSWEEHVDGLWHHLRTKYRKTFARHLVEDGAPVINAHDLTLHPPFPRLLSDMFPRPNPDLVDDEKLVAIERLFELQSRVALVGMADVGKTELAREYCYREAARWPQSHIFWISAGDQNRQRKSFRAMMKGVNLPGYDDKNELIDAEMLLRVLDTHTPWILVVDGLNHNILFMGTPSIVSQGGSYDDLLLLLLSGDRGGKVLLTTQSFNVAFDLVQSSQIVEVEILTEEASISLLRSRLNFESNLDNSELAELAEIAKYRLIRLVRICEQSNTLHPRVDMNSFVPYIREVFSDSNREPDRDLDNPETIPGVNTDSPDFAYVADPTNVPPPPSVISTGSEWYHDDEMIVIDVDTGSPDFAYVTEPSTNVLHSPSPVVSTGESSGGVTRKAEESEQIQELDSDKAGGEEAR
ncbi:hypothetical protein C7974DRAFT_375086 [Boeremia exigua]|uniref:uncharacterized protein n=1 Tax=Boeremia exigua TaxID=749465 RepID=UPI001E8E813A|nr:uncharacterized protein C7974DRAFT_375086 [Boeremia exigua]KAH6632931.1 hypothetical protein C7974DRAFT_375086 [Boeremia exigua]